MTTRSGRQYKDDPRAEAMAEEGETYESGGGGPRMVPEGGHEDGELVTMFRMMQAQQEQQQWWQERAQEQQQRMMETQMNALQSVLERGAEREAEGTWRPRERAGEAAEQIKLTRLSEADDVEAYLTTFERMMRLGHVHEDLWTLRLAPQLTGKAQQAYAALNVADASQYGKVKEAILRRYDINEETYRQCFRNERRKTIETYRELVARLHDLASKWTAECSTVEEVVKLVVEQLATIMPADLRIWLAERKPTTGAEAGKLADDYCQARRHVRQGNQGGSDRGSSGSGEVRKSTSVE